MMNLIKYDGLVIPCTFSEGFENLENISKSEAGNDLGNVVRLQKLTLSCSCKCDGHLKKKIQEKGLIPEAMAEYGGRTFKARLRVSGAPHEEFSEEIPGADSLWTVSFSIIEV